MNVIFKSFFFFFPIDGNLVAVFTMPDITGAYDARQSVPRLDLIANGKTQLKKQTWMELKKQTWILYHKLKKPYF